VIGKQNGKLYALKLTANDTTTGASSPASPLDVVVGSSSTDIVSLATLVGSAKTATPTFIYGLAGKDTINGTGMTGELWFAGGAGADKITGGSATRKTCDADYVSSLSSLAAIRAR
jgi:Ca2+-binding RTX toxin-like protein